MAPLNQVIAERKQVFRDLKKHLKMVDTQVEAMQRKIESVLRRKYKVPEDSDLLALEQNMDSLGDGVHEFLKILERGFVL